MIKIYDIETLEEREILFRGEAGGRVRPGGGESSGPCRSGGDAALREYTLRFDGAAPDALAVTAEEVDQAAAQVEPAFLAVLEEAAEHPGLPRPAEAGELRDDRAGGAWCWASGSSPWRGWVSMCPAARRLPFHRADECHSRPDRRSGGDHYGDAAGADGAVNPHILAAAKIAGVTRIYKVGGAQAVAALAYGTGTIPQVDKIVGPGNAYVAEAKRQVFGRVNIDMIAGPSEVLVLADGRSNPAWVAADLLSQAEHDRMAAAVLVTDSPPLAEAVAHELERQLAALPRAETARASLEANGKLIVCRDLREGHRGDQPHRPGHLELCVDNPSTTWGRFRTPLRLLGPL